MVEVNLNQTVKVKLTSHGIGILRDFHNEKQDKIHFINHSYEKLPFKLRLDDEGYYTTQMWTLMQTFGNHVGLGRRSPFDIVILIE